MRWDFIFVWLASKARFKKKGIRHDTLDKCLNCEFQLDESHLFCPECGQKVHESKLTIWTLIAEFFAGLFNLDNGLYKSIIWLPVPAYLSRKFMEGKRKKYLNPIRFFLVALIIHIAVITDIIPLDLVSQENIKSMQDLGQARMHDKFTMIKDSLSERYEINDIDSLEKAIFNNVSKTPDTIYVNSSNSRNGVFFNTGFSKKKLQFSKADLYDMPIEEFLKTYNLETYWEQVIMTQVVRAARDPSGALKFAIGNLIWIIFSVILLEGLFMKLLYIRRNRYYVEHLVVLFNIHTFAFLIGSIGLWVGFKFQGPDNDIDDIAYVIIALFFFLSIKFYYKQGWIKSFLKFAMLGFMYLSLLFFMILFVTMVSFFFF